ncbi:MAG: hypothetical protein AMJ55_08030 [Gammaproteobacteria bacterium SG8_15]|nr:MAG: hypothetical protein AMJ55_08030 [Gammaproteobacteria bacterium SG8_15]
MKKSRLEIFVGARGWNYPEWSGEFYPEDLPEDWRFSYYSNELQAVLIPYDYLLRYPLEEWAEWVEDAPKEFAFYVELSGGASWADVHQVLEVLGELLKGIVIVMDRLPDIEALASLVRRAKAMAPVCIHSSGGKVSDQDMQTLQSCHEVNECWNGEDEAPVWGYSGAAVLLRDSRKQNSPDILRQMIEKGIEYAGACDAIALFFTGDSPKISDMRNARTITDLLV